MADYIAVEMSLRGPDTDAEEWGLKERVDEIIDENRELFDALHE